MHLSSIICLALLWAHSSSAGPPLDVTEPDIPDNTTAVPDDAMVPQEPRSKARMAAGILAVIVIASVIGACIIGGGILYYNKRKAEFSMLRYKQQIDLLAHDDDDDEMQVF
eukprot:TRINITY_DN5532_c2_g1_i1.p2 TRINITY_DN5532_c2_g1~~TRINITY_DN5532_c2_g1_i1.p2  ORF type:complete len:111 (+),score=14.02 TRINITY_DN5532_c2_g1_i1:13-345(+)